MELNVIHQSCRDCVFAVYDGKTQKGCSFQNRLAAFETAGCVVEAYDEEKEFSIVNGRKCTAYRDMDWGKNHPPENREGAARCELTVRLDIIIPLQTSCDERALRLTIDSLREQILSPSSVMVISNQDVMPTPRLHARLSKIAHGLNWSLTDIRERTDDGARVDQWRAIDLAVGKLKGHFYTVFEPGAWVPEKFALNLDRAVTDRMERFSVLLPNSLGDGLTVALGFHTASQIGGNRPIIASTLNEDGTEKPGVEILLNNVVEKALYIAKSHNMLHLVGNMEDLCNHF